MKNESHPLVINKEKELNEKPIFIWTQTENVPGYYDETANFEITIDNEECEIIMSGIRTEAFLVDHTKRVPKEKEEWFIYVTGDIEEIKNNFKDTYQFDNKEEAVIKAQELAQDLVALKLEVENQKRMDTKVQEADSFILKKIEGQQTQLIDELKDLLDKYNNRNNESTASVIPEDKEIENPSIEEIADLFKKYKIDQIILAGENSKEEVLLTPDFDTQFALYLLHNLNKNKLTQTYSYGAISTIVDKKEDLGHQLTEEENQLNNDGLKIILDTGGEWLKIKYKDGEKIIYIDHHGKGKREATSGTKMVYEIMKKAGILKEEAWLENFVKMTNNLDNLSYVDKKNKEGDKLFNENYFRSTWPKTIFALAEDYLPLEKTIELFKKGIIKDPFAPIPDADLDGEIGKTEIDFYGQKKTLKEIVEMLGEKATQTVESVKRTRDYQEYKGYNFKTKEFGKIIYHNFKCKYIDIKEKDEKKAYKTNTIDKKLGFKAVKATNNDTYIVWNKKEDTFFINTSKGDLTKLAERLNQAEPNCAKEIRDVFIFGKIGNLKENDLLNLIDPNIIINSK